VKFLEFFGVEKISALIMTSHYDKIIEAKVAVISNARQHEDGSQIIFNEKDEAIPVARTKSSNTDIDKDVPNSHSKFEVSEQPDEEIPIVLSKNAKSTSSKVHPFSVEAITSRHDGYDNHSNRKRSNPNFRNEFYERDEKLPKKSSEDNKYSSYFYSHYCYPKKNCSQHEELQIKPHPLNLLRTRIIDRLDETFPQGKLCFLEDDVKIGNKSTTAASSKSISVPENIKQDFQKENKLSHNLTKNPNPISSLNNGHPTQSHGNLPLLPKSTTYRSPRTWNLHPSKRHNLQPSSTY